LSKKRNKYGGQRPARAERIKARRAETIPSGGRVIENNKIQHTAIHFSSAISKFVHLIITIMNCRQDGTAAGQ